MYSIPALSNPSSPRMRRLCSHSLHLLASVCIADAGQSHECFSAALSHWVFFSPPGGFLCSVDTDCSILLEDFFLFFSVFCDPGFLFPGSLPALLSLPFSSLLIFSSALFLNVPVLASGAAPLSSPLHGVCSSTLRF